MGGGGGHWSCRRVHLRINGMGGRGAGVGAGPGWGGGRVCTRQMLELRPGQDGMQGVAELVEEVARLGVRHEGGPQVKQQGHQGQLVLPVSQPLLAAEGEVGTPGKFVMPAQACESTMRWHGLQNRGGGAVVDCSKEGTKSLQVQWTKVMNWHACEFLVRIVGVC